ncbi:MAG: RnfH family protein [Burkholderiaceae bacterium]
MAETDPSVRIARITVVYAMPERQTIIELEVPERTSVADAVLRSGLAARFADIASRPLACAIYGRLVPLTHPVRDGDRIEILRPLLIDPKENRRRTARAAPLRKQQRR